MPSGIPRTVAAVSLALSLTASGAPAGDLGRGQSLFLAGRYREAARFYREMLGALPPYRADSLYRLGLALYMGGERKEANARWEEAGREDSGIFAGRILRIATASMEPRLEEGDHIIVDRERYRHLGIARGEIAVFRRPGAERATYIERVVGLPGERIEARGGRIFVNGASLPGKFRGRGRTEDFGPIALGRGAYFMMGDNREDVLDSRHFGPVARRLFIGKALAVYASVAGLAEVISPGAGAARAGIILE